MKTLDFLKTAVSHAETNHAAHLKRIHEAQEAAAEIQRKLQFGVPRPKGAPAVQYELATLEAARTLATRNAEHAAADLEGAKATLAAAVRNPEVLDAYDRAFEAACSLDRARTAALAELIRDFADDDAELQVLMDAAFGSWSALGAAAREVVPLPVFAWRAQPSEPVAARIARVLGALVKAGSDATATPPGFPSSAVKLTRRG